MGERSERLHSTRGGESETELNELQVKPIGPPLASNVLTIATPVGNVPSALRKSRGSKASPGAQLTGKGDEGYLGTVKVKVGPITASYRGSADFVTKDDDAKRALDCSLAMVHAKDDESARRAAESLRAAYTLGDPPPDAPPVLDVLR